MIGQTSNSDTLLLSIDPDVVHVMPPNSVLKLVSAKPLDVMSLSDEGALTEFFGVGLYERSTFGAIVDFLKYGAMGSHDCARCDGTGILNDGGFRVDDTCRQCKGEGYEPGAEKACSLCRATRKEAPYRVELKHGGWCGSCSGTGAAGIDRRDGKPPACGSCPGKASTKKCKNCGVCKSCRDARACRACRNCLGTGVEPVSVHQTGEEGATGREGADEGALAKFALISRRLERVRTKSPALRRALARYYGDEGERWGLTDRGRIFALYAETPAGKRLVRLSRKRKAKAWVNPKPVRQSDPFPDGVPTAGVVEELWERTWKASRPAHLREFIGPIQERGWLPSAPPNEHDIDLPKKHMTPSEIIEFEGNAERKHSEPRRRELLVEAGKQARKLYADSVVAWNEARANRQTKVTRSLVKRATRLGLVTLANHLADAAGSK